MKNKKYIDILAKYKDFNSLYNQNNKEIFMNNLDNYISFLYNQIHINDNELLYIIDLTIHNKYNHILYCNNIEEKEYIKIFMYNYNKNINYLKKYIHIKKRSFKSLINNINKHKKRIYPYFEIITYENISFYLPLIIKLES